MMSVILIIVFAVVSTIVINRVRQKQAHPSEETGRGSFACIADAKQCPDGSYVGRVAPYCQFAPCP